MTEIYPNLFIGTVEEAKRVMSRDWTPFWCVVNLASTFHYENHGWKKGLKDHPCYVMCVEYPYSLLSLNWVDGPAYLYDYQGKGVERFRKILDFIDTGIKTHKVLIVCNQGVSRSPSVALVYLAKYLHKIPSESYAAAKEEFIKLYPMYAPGGIADFLSQHWDEI
jgi:hypothetical protein